jgi:ADP-heptose:LPS heptosyltransferase
LKEDLSGKRILIVKPSSLGDIVHTLPLAHAIKRCFPSCYVGWIVQKTFRAILESDPAVDEIIPISIPSTSEPTAGIWSVVRATGATLATLRSLRTRFKDRPYDVVLDLHASFRSGLLGLANPNGLRIGFADAKELNTLFQHRKIDPGSEAVHAVDKNVAFAQYLGCIPDTADFKIISNSAAGQSVNAFLTEAGISRISRLVYANPAARWATKYWNINAWAELADLLIERTGASVIFAGSPDDLPHIQQITARMKQMPLVAAGKLNLAESVALMELCSVYVGVDSGPMHIAAFAGIPVVALFGPTDPSKVGPYGPGHKVIQNSGVHCLACRKHKCDDRRCLDEITAAHVFDETIRLVGWKRDAG